jgi:hypothetical protein
LFSKTARILPQSVVARVHCRDIQRGYGQASQVVTDKPMKLPIA